MASLGSVFKRLTGAAKQAAPIAKTEGAKVGLLASLRQTGRLIEGEEPEQNVPQEPKVASQAVSGNDILNHPGVGLIKDYEKLKLEAYHATEKERKENVVTIGYGTQGRHQIGDKIDKETATAYLRDHLEGLDGWMEDNITAELNPNQRGAVLSLLYNIGTSTFKKSKAFKALNKGDFDTFKKEAFDPELGFVKEAKGLPPLKGLVRRRADEQALFDQEVE